MSDQQRTDGGSFTDGSVEIGGSTISIKLIVGALILIGVIFFVFQNTQPVALSWLFFEFTMPLWGLTVILFGAGMLMGWALHLRRQRRRPR
ncbi:MAG: LapA family protein [Nitriliruptor sp.]|nr:MAG: LapA family protein [Nitriliruptor sp.]